MAKTELFIEILAKYDMMRLIKHGSPADEYSPEAEEILTRLYPAGSKTHVLDIVYEVFTDFFAPLPVGDKHGYYRMAMEIYEANRLED